jgi:hypothetical protein
MTPETPLRGLKLQDRDRDLLRGLFESRLMNLAHVAALHFDGRLEAAKKRVQKLKAAGLIAERPRRAYEPSILFLTGNAFDVLHECGALAEYPEFSRPALEKRGRVSELTLRHELRVMDVKAAVVATMRNSNQCQPTEFSTWPLLFQFQAEQRDGAEITVKPDGFIRIHETMSGGDVFEHTFFLEVDRSTESQEILAQKSLCYRDYYRSGGFALKNGRPRSEFESYPFRVLMVFQNAERRNNAAERMLLCHPPVLTQVWLTTFPEIVATPLGAIWVRPFDYQAAIKGTAFNNENGRVPAIYRRRPEREAFVEGRVQKQALLAADS